MEKTFREKVTDAFKEIRRITKKNSVIVRTLIDLRVDSFVLNDESIRWYAETMDKEDYSSQVDFKQIDKNLFILNGNVILACNQDLSGMFDPEQSTRDTNLKCDKEKIEKALNDRMKRLKSLKGKKTTSKNSLCKLENSVRKMF